VSADLHSNLFGNSCSNHVSNGGTTKIMKQAFYSRLSASCRPSLAKIARRRRLAGILVAVISGCAAIGAWHPWLHTKASAPLSWKAINPPPGIVVVGYEIYRSQEDGPFEKIAGITGTSYLDMDIRAGQTYHYFVRAVDQQGRASPPSNMTVLTVP
jgi:hypothetical protein